MWGLSAAAALDKYRTAPEMTELVSVMKQSLVLAAARGLIFGFDRVTEAVLVAQVN